MPTPPAGLTPDPARTVPPRDHPVPLEGAHLVWWRWLLVGVWAILPFTTGGLLSAALDGSDRPLRITVLALAWLWWGLGLLAALVPQPVGLVVLRVGATTAAVAGLWSLTRNVGAGTGTVGLLGSAAGLAVALAAETGLVCVNGRSYPNERRYLLRPARMLLLGPIPLTALMLGAGVFTGPALLAQRRWLLGTIALLAGGALAFVAARALYALTNRFVVFVPAGFVVHDGEALRDTVLFKRGVVEAIRRAPAGSESLDLTHGAPGRRIEVLLLEKTEVTRVANSRSTGDTGKTAMFLVTPTRPGWVLRTAAARGYTTH